MKFQTLPLGARFEYEGKVYVKTGPLTAASEEGGQRMIPRFAVLRPLDGTSPPARPARRLDEARVRAAIEVFHGDCIRILEEGETDLLRARSRRAALDVAKASCLAALEEPGAEPAEA